MKIQIITSPLKDGNAVRGVGRYTEELVSALEKLHTPHKFLTNDDNSQADLVHYPFFDLFFHTLPIHKQMPTVVTIHDVTPMVFARHYPRGLKGEVRFMLQRLALRSVAHIITDSLVSKRDISSHLGIYPDRISVIPLAASSEIQKPPQAIIDAVRKKYELPKNYCLYVGDIGFNKNLPFLIRVLKRFPHLSLVMVGRNIKNFSIPEGKAIQNAITSLEMGKRIFLLAEVSLAQDLSSLYAGAIAYIQPSLYEGFGLPVLEAMQCRTIVISSRGGSLPEVVGDAALLFHPHDEDECVGLIQKVLRMEDSQRHALILKGVARASQFSWERTAKETLSVYSAVVR